MSPTGLGTPLYDMSARFYNPGIGAFTQLDSVMGSAQDPLSMNRFLVCGGQSLDPERSDRALLRGSEPQPLRPHRDHRQHRRHGRGRRGDDRIAATTAVAGTIGLGAVAVGAAAGAAASVASDVMSGNGLRLESALSGAAAGATFVIVAGVTKNVTLAGAASGAVATSSTRASPTPPPAARAASTRARSRCQQQPVAPSACSARRSVTA